MNKTLSIAVILASGNGARFGSTTPKQFMKVAGKSVLEHTIDAFERHAGIDEIVIVSSRDHLLLTEEMVTRVGYRKVRKIVSGGSTRQQSSAAGIQAVEGDHHKVLVHDSVRPLIDRGTIQRCLDALDTHAAVDTAIPASDTIIRLSDAHEIAEIPDRSQLYLGQTPQAFRAGVLREAHRRAAQDRDLKVTDDCGLILHYQLGPVFVVPGDVNNIKITYASDIYLADRIFQVRARQGAEDLDLGRELAGRTVLVFGATRGIGESVAALAGSLGANVLAVSRRTGTDVTDPASVRAALEEAIRLYGRVDAVVNTAGVLRTGLLDAQDYDSIDEQIAINLRGCLVVAKESFCAMRRSGGSIALFTSSSYTRGRARYSVYSATKAAVVNLAQGLAEEFMPFGVRINVINPERTATPMRTENFGTEPADDLLTAESVAAATLAACVSSATGEVIDVRRP